MTKYFLFLLLALCFIHFSFSQDTALRSTSVLVASRNGAEEVYTIGTKLVLKYKDSLSVKRIRGVFSGSFEGKVLITKGNKNNKVLISVDSIILLRKIHPIRRIVFAAIGTALIGGGAAILDNGGDTPGSAIGGAFIIPVIGLGVLFVYTVPASLILEKINENRKSRGWKFSLH